MVNILLACGQGFSSGFIANAMRKAAKSKLIEATISAVGDIEVPNSIEKGTADIILLGPHIKYKQKEFEDLAAKHNRQVLISVMNQKDYSQMNGAAILKDAMELYNSK